MDICGRMLFGGAMPISCGICSLVGIDPNARDRHGQTGLMLAAHAGHLAVVQFLIDHGVDLNAQPNLG